MKLAVCFLQRPRVTESPPGFLLAAQDLILSRRFYRWSICDLLWTLDVRDLHLDAHILGGTTWRKRGSQWVTFSLHPKLGSRYGLSGCVTATELDYRFTMEMYLLHLWQESRSLWTSGSMSLGHKQGTVVSCWSPQFWHSRLLWCHWSLLRVPHWTHIRQFYKHTATINYTAFKKWDVMITMSLRAAPTLHLQPLVGIESIAGCKQKVW